MFEPMDAEMREIWASKLAELKALLKITTDAVAAERARCLAIVERYTDDLQPGAVQIAAGEISSAILEE